MSATTTTKANNNEWLSVTIQRFNSILLQNSFVVRDDPDL